MKGNSADYLRIAQVAPLYESVPPRLYGGTERVVSYLTEELVSLGHEVTLFASGDSRTSAKLVRVCPRALRLDQHCSDQLIPHMILLDRVLERAADFDVIHFHIDYLHFPLSRHCHLPSVTTLHGRLDLPDLVPLYECFHDAPVISISYAQRKPLPYLHWLGNVYHGIPPRQTALGNGDGGYLAFLGRISPEKRPDRAIEIAVKTGMPLKIAAKIDPVDRPYFEKQIKPLLKHPNVEYIGEISDAEKPDFLGKAYAYLFPIDWPEPFGLSMVEAMQCGTPTIAFNCGSVPELMTHGTTGFVVNSVEEAIRAVPLCASFDRQACRRAFQARFTSTRMAGEYVTLYTQLVQSRSTVSRPAAHAERSKLLEV